MSKLDIKPPVKECFEDMVVDAFSADKSTHMSTKLGFMIEFKGGLDEFSL